MMLDGAKTVDRGGRRGLRGRRLRALLRPRAASRAPASSTTAACEPLGVVVVTPPWNFPLSIPAGGVLAALAAGQRRHPQAGARGGARRLGAGRLPVGGGRPARRPPVPAVPRRRGRPWRSSRDPRVDARHPHRLGGDRPAVPRLAARSAALRRDQRQERHHRHRAGRPRPGHPRPRPLGLRPQRPEVLGGQPRHLRGRGVRRRRLPAPAARRRGEPRRRQRVGADESRDAAHPAARAPRSGARSPSSTPGEEWLLEPRPVGGQPAALVARHQARRAARLVLPPHRVLRPGAGADARRGPRPGHRPRERHAVRPHQRDPDAGRSRDRALGRPDRGGQPLRQPARSPAPIVGRQPFGGWKASSVGPGAKAGGPNYVLQLARWQPGHRAPG